MLHLGYRLHTSLADAWRLVSIARRDFHEPVRSLIPAFGRKGPAATSSCAHANELQLIEHVSVFTAEQCSKCCISCWILLIMNTVPVILVPPANPLLEYELLRNDGKVYLYFYYNI
jgi:hypothetical protein